jgi:hypothetical protein
MQVRARSSQRLITWWAVSAATVVLAAGCVGPPSGGGGGASACPERGTTVLSSTGSPVRPLARAVSPNGDWAVTGVVDSTDWNLQVHPSDDLAAAVPVLTLDNPEFVGVSDDGERVVIGESFVVAGPSPSRVRVWDRATDQVTLMANPIVPGKDVVQLLGLSDDGARAVYRAITPGTSPQLAVVVDVATGTQVATVTLGDGAVGPLSPGAASLSDLSGSVLHDLDTGDTLDRSDAVQALIEAGATVAVPSQPSDRTADAVAVSDNARYTLFLSRLLDAQGYLRLYVWDAVEAELTRVPGDLGNVVWGVSVSDDGEVLFLRWVSLLEQQLVAWDETTGSFRALTAGSVIDPVAYDPDDLVAASADHRTVLVGVRRDVPGPVHQLLRLSCI